MQFRGDVITYKNVWPTTPTFISTLKFLIVAAALIRMKKIISQCPMSKVHLRLLLEVGGGPRVVVSTAVFHAFRGSRSRPFERNKNVSSPSTCESKYYGEPP